MRLLGRERGQEWTRWAGVVLTPVVGVLLLARCVARRESPVPAERGAPSPTSSATVVTIAWTFVLQHPFSIGTADSAVGYVASLLILVLLVGELVRVVYLLVQRLRSARAAQPRADTAPVTPAWVSIAVPAVAIGLWVAADVLLLEGLLDILRG